MPNLYKKPRKDKRIHQLQMEIKRLEDEVWSVRLDQRKAERTAFESLPETTVRSSHGLRLPVRLVRWTAASVWVASSAIAAASGGTRFNRGDGKMFHYRGGWRDQLPVDEVEDIIKRFEESR